MRQLPFNPLLDVPAYPAGRFAALADRVKPLMETKNDVLPIQAEAALALEAVAASVGRPGLTALSVVTSPYGSWFSAWLRRAGCAVVEVYAAPGQPVSVESVAEGLRRAGHVDIVATVHGEAANGALNPLAEIAGLARSKGALLVVDAVSSVGAHKLGTDELGIDMAVIGMQKALGGPAGVSMVSVSPRAWAHMAAGSEAIPSMLSLPDLKRRWLDTGRGGLPGTPAPLEFRALEAALDRIEAEGMEALIARHTLAARATRRGLRAMGIEPAIIDDSLACGLVTAVPVPRGMTCREILDLTAAFPTSISDGVGPDAEGHLLRLAHYGATAAYPQVLANVTAFGHALKTLGRDVDPGRGAAAVTRAYAAPNAREGMEL